MMQAIKPELIANKLGIEKKTQSYSTPFFRPATHINPNNIWLRRMTRIVRHLRDDLARMHPNIVMPTTWMIKCLLASMSRPNVNSGELNQFDVSDEQWERNLLTLLHKLHEYSNSSEHIRNAFFELDGFTPLFPNQELFGPQHVHKFSQLALKYLDSSTAKAS